MTSIVRSIHPPVLTLLNGAMAARKHTLRTVASHLRISFTLAQRKVLTNLSFTPEELLQLSTLLDLPINWLYQAVSAQHFIDTPLERIARKEYDDYLASQCLTKHPFLRRNLENV